MTSEMDNSIMYDRIVGLHSLVRLDSGQMVPAINLDNAATTPPFIDVAEEIHDKLHYYGSIGRGKGQKSEISSRVYTNGRDIIKDFAGANHDKYTAIYVNGTTDGINKLASALVTSRNDIVLTTRMEHHANDLPWRERCRTVYADVDESGRLRVGDIECLLKRLCGKIKLVSVTAASNVTGYVNDVHEIAKLAHRYGAQIVVDGAQIVAHRGFSMLGQHEDQDIDYFIFSAHKMYSPYGGGVLVGLKDVLDKRLPTFYGGGMVERVADRDVEFSPSPDRYEAGSPNYPGVVGMLKSMQILKQVGFERIKEHEQVLLKMAISALREIPSVMLYGDCDNIDDRVGILTFNLKNMNDDEVANRLAGLWAIAVRHAKFCAHPYVDRLLRFVDNATSGCITHNGMVRISFGIYNTEQDVHALVHAVEELSRQLGSVDAVPAMARVTSALPMRQPNDRG